MGEREAPRGSPDEGGIEARIVRAKPGIFSLRNIIILTAGVVLSSLLAIFVVEGILAPSLERRRLNQQLPAAPAEKRTEAGLEELVFFQIEPLIVNPAGSNGERYLKASVTLEMDDVGVRQEIDKRLPQIKNQINNVLSSKTIEQIQTNEDRKNLQREILEKVNGMLIKGRVSNVYFEEFVYQ